MSAPKAHRDEDGEDSEEETSECFVNAMQGKIGTSAHDQTPLSVRRAFVNAGVKPALTGFEGGKVQRRNWAELGSGYEGTHTYSPLEGQDFGLPDEMKAINSDRRCRKYLIGSSRQLEGDIKKFRDRQKETEMDMLYHEKHLIEKKITHMHSLISGAKVGMGLSSSDFVVVDVGMHLAASQFTAGAHIAKKPFNYALEFEVDKDTRCVMMYKPPFPLGQLQKINGLYAKVGEGKYTNARNCVMERRSAPSGGGIWVIVVPDVEARQSESSDARFDFYVRMCVGSDDGPPCGIWFHKNQQFFVGVQRACPLNMWMSLHWECVIEILELNSHEETDRNQTFQGIVASAWNVSDLSIFTGWALTYLPNVDKLDYSAFVVICSGVSIAGVWLLSQGLADMCIENAPSSKVREAAAWVTMSCASTSIIWSYVLACHNWFPSEPFAVITGWKWVLASCLACSCVCSAPWSSSKRVSFSKIAEVNGGSAYSSDIFEGVREIVAGTDLFLDIVDWNKQVRFVRIVGMFERCCIGCLVSWVCWYWDLTAKTLTISKDNIIYYFAWWCLANMCMWQSILPPEPLTEQYIRWATTRNGDVHQTEPFAVVGKRLLLRLLCLMVAVEFLKKNEKNMIFTHADVPTFLFIVFFCTMITIYACRSFFFKKSNQSIESATSARWSQTGTYAKHQEYTFLMWCLSKGMLQQDLTNTKVCLNQMHGRLRCVWETLLQKRMKRDAIGQSKLAQLQHTILEMCYDISQIVVMAWVDSNVTLTKDRFAGKLMVDFMNWMSTLIDLLVLKGPKVVAGTGGNPQEVMATLSSTIEEMEADVAFLKGARDTVEFQQFQDPEAADWLCGEEEEELIDFMMWDDRRFHTLPDKLTAEVPLW